MSSKQRESNGLVGPILLIGVGLIFLFNNLGWLDWNIWSALWRLWPLLLIIGGLDLIIGRRSTWGSALVAVIAVVLLVGGFLFVGGASSVSRSGFTSELTSGSSTTMDGQSVIFPAQGAGQAKVEISTGAGELYVADGAASANVLDGQIQSQRGEVVRQSSGMDGETLQVMLKSTGTDIPVLGGPNSVWDLRLNQEIPLDLAISTGVGASLIDLRRLTVTNLKLNTGVGKTTVLLPRRGGLTGEISGGIGEIVVRVPDNLAVRLEISTGIGGRSVPDDFRQEGDVYFSPSYREGADGVTLQVSGGIGMVRVESLPAE